MPKLIERWIHSLVFFFSADNRLVLLKSAQIGSDWPREGGWARDQCAALNQQILRREESTSSRLNFRGSLSVTRLVVIHWRVEEELKLTRKS